MLDYLFLGAIQFFIGLAFTLSPPKKPNDMYGYWGKAAKKNVESWQLAHKISGLGFLLTGMLSVVMGWWLFSSELSYSRTISLFTSLILGLLVILFTERKLKKLNS